MSASKTPAERIEADVAPNVEEQEQRTSTSLVEILSAQEEADAAAAETAKSKAAESAPPNWDKERQKRDEEFAATRRELAERDRILAEKDKELEALKSKSAPSAAAKTAAEQDAELEAEFEIPDAPDVDQLADALKKRDKRLKALDTEIQKLRKEQDESRKTTETQRQTQQFEENQTALQGHVDKEVQRYGEDERGRIDAEVNRIFVEDWGYEPGQLPGGKISKSVVAEAVRNLDLIPKAKSRAGAPPVAPRLDATRRGAPIERQQFRPGTETEVEADMRKSGRYV